MDVRRSRRDRLASIPPDHLLLMARAWVFDGCYHTSVAHVTKVLESAAARGSEESGWLLDKLRSSFVGRVVLMGLRTRRWSRRGGGGGTARGVGSELADASLVASW